MKKEIADLWVKALRSGEYKQGKYRLEHNGRFCCLGILCKLAGPEIAPRSETALQAVYYDGQTSSLPDSVMEWSGMSTREGGLPPSADGWPFLSVHNDSGTPFPEIADLIEKHWEAL